MKKLNEISPEARLLLLIIIEKNGSIDDLYNLGYEYFQITKFLKDEIQAKNAKLIDGQLHITEKGLEEKLSLIKKLNKDKSEKIIMPQLSKKDKSRYLKNDVFIPSQDELNF